MLTNKKMEEIMGLILTIGTLTSAVIVLLGGIYFLALHGNEPIDTELLVTSLPSLSIITLGLFFLVGTQILRVGLLVWYYLSIRDYPFTVISGSVLCVILFTILVNMMGWKIQ